MVSKVAAAFLAALGLTSVSAPVQHVSTRPGGTGPRAVQVARAQPLPVVFVTGHGWGHGVGLAQYGAYGYALHGWSWDKIVAHYYPGTTLGDAPVKKVRVLLAAGAKRAVISSHSAYTVVDGAGKSHKLTAGVQRIGPGLKVRLSPANALTALPGPLVFTPGSRTALPRGPRLSRIAARPGRRLRSPDRERRRARVVPPRRRRVGNARPLAGRGARRASRRRSHLRACPDGRHRAPSTSTTTRAARSTVESRPNRRAPWPPSPRLRARWSSMTTNLP